MALKSAGQSAYYFYHQRTTTVLRDSWRTPLFMKQLIVPCPTSTRTKRTTMASFKNIDRKPEMKNVMQNITISKRLRLVRPAGTAEGWPYAVNREKILVIFLPWLNSKEEHVSKYLQLYLDLGLDVLCFKSKTQDFLWPPTSLKAAKELSEILSQCKDYDHYLFHSMSIGSYNLTTFRILAKEEPEVAELSKKVRGIIYDSIVIGAGKGGALSKTANGSHDAEDDAKAIDRFVRGMASSVSHSKVVLFLVAMLSRIYFSLTKKQTLDFYEKAYGVVRDEPVAVPTLVFSSKDDPMSDKDVVEQIVSIWKNDHNVPVSIQMWEKSGHARHLALHRKEYTDTQRKFLSEIFDGLEKGKRDSKSPTKAKL